MADVISRTPSRDVEQAPAVIGAGKIVTVAATADCRIGHDYFAAL